MLHNGAEDNVFWHTAVYQLIKNAHCKIGSGTSPHIAEMVCILPIFRNQL